MGNRKWDEDAAPLDKDAAVHLIHLRRSGDFLPGPESMWPRPRPCCWANLRPLPEEIRPSK